MIKFVTVWVLTIGYFQGGYNKGGPTTYQLQYSSQEICEKQRKNHSFSSKYNGFSRCDFQQIPVVMK